MCATARGLEAHSESKIVETEKDNVALKKKTGGSKEDDEIRKYESGTHGEELGGNQEGAGLHKDESGKSGKELVEIWENVHTHSPLSPESEVVTPSAAGSAHLQQSCEQCKARLTTLCAENGGNPACQSVKKVVAQMNACTPLGLRLEGGAVHLEDGDAFGPVGGVG